MYQVQTQLESNQWLKNWYLSLTSQVLDIIRIGQGLVGSMPGECDWVGYQVMVLVAWSPNGATSCHKCDICHALSQISTHPDMILDIARMKDNKHASVSLQHIYATTHLQRKLIHYGTDQHIHTFHQSLTHPSQPTHQRIHKLGLTSSCIHTPPSYTHRHSHTTISPWTHTPLVNYWFSLV